MFSKIFYIGFVVSVLLLAACDSNNGDKSNQSSRKGDLKLQKESLIVANKYLVNSENTDITNYINRHKLSVVETGSGLRYQITSNGTGTKAEIGNIVVLNYKVKLISGDVIYSSDENGPLQFKIGHGGIETGLEEAILHMRVGDKAIIIIPSHLAYGLLGDSKRIPKRSTIIYEIEVTNIN